MLTHEKIPITFAEYGALLGTREMMKEQILRAAKGHSDPVPNEHLFNMNCAMKFEQCGTIGCIGGHMALILGWRSPYESDAHRGASYHAYMYVDHGRSKALYDLFYPHPLHEWEQITPEMAVEAIDNFLEYGDPKWVKVALNNHMEAIVPWRYRGEYGAPTL